MVQRTSRPVSAKVTSSSPLVDPGVKVPRVSSAGTAGRSTGVSRIPRPPDKIPTTGPRAIHTGNY